MGRSIIKGVLFYITALLLMIFVTGIDSIYDKDILLPYIFTLAILIVICRKTLNRKDIRKFSLYEFFNKIF